MENDIQKTANYAKIFFANDASGHDWWHTFRVWQTAKKIEAKEGGDPFIIEMAALLHDVDDYKFSNVKDEKIKTKTRAWLRKIGIEPFVSEKIVNTIQVVSFKGDRNEPAPETLEGKIVQDADRLDALGAIGIARTFATGGHRGRSLHNPDLKPRNYKSFEEYKKQDESSIKHFYEKILVVKDLMNTKTALSIAKKRHKFVEDYLKEFFIEWESKDIAAA